MLREKLPIFKYESYLDQHLKYHNHALSKIIQGVGTFNHCQLI